MLLGYSFSLTTQVRLSYMPMFGISCMPKCHSACQIQVMQLMR